MTGFRNPMRAVAVATTLAMLGGCAATQVAVSKRELDVQARTSTAIFVDAVARDNRTVFLDVRSGVMEFDRRAFATFVREQFAQNDNGYKLVDDPDKAQYQMQVYVLNLEKASPTAAETALRQGYVGDYDEKEQVSREALDLDFDGKVDQVNYYEKGVIVRKDTQISTKVADAGGSTQRVSEARDRKEYTTRIVTTANKVNLKLEQAQDLMFRKTAYAMSGFF